MRGALLKGKGLTRKKRIRINAIPLSSTLEGRSFVGPEK